MAIKRHPRSCLPNCDTSAHPTLLHLWLLRLMVPLGGHHKFVGEQYLKNEDIAAALGLADLSEPDENTFNAEKIRHQLRQLHQQIEQQAEQIKPPAILHHNVERLAELVGLSLIDCRILELSIMLSIEHVLEEASDLLGNSLSSIKTCYVLSKLLDLPEPEVRAALSSKGVLAQSGLVTLDYQGTSRLTRKLDLLSNHFAHIICSSEADPIELFADSIRPTVPPQLQLTDYAHIQDSLNLALPYLKQALKQGRSGVNLFLYGPPGTGKSELAKRLAQELGSELFEIASENSDGAPISGERRLRAFRAAQSCFSQRRTLLLFDEVEDVFHDGDLFCKSTAQSHKAWINHMLEHNCVPTLWLSNSIRDLDPAFIRRFDLLIELPIPPKNQRTQLLQACCGDLLDADSIDNIAEMDTLAPAVVTRSASVVRSIQDQLPRDQLSRAMQQLLNNTLQAQGHSPLPHPHHKRLPELYDPSLLNCDINLQQLAEGIQNHRNARLCLYGPPGTGKTAYAHWLAQQLDAPLLLKRASDLISKWVGESEQNLAQAFREAEQEKAILLIDEVDSFLQDRRQAMRHWEVTQVNEMLTQMENFSGVFIASTNLMHQLDQAALRRFDIKIQFNYLRPQQAWDLLQRYCQQFGLAPADPMLYPSLQKLPQLTPGDFATVARQHRFQAIPNGESFIQALIAESAIKENARQPIGFI